MTRDQGERGQASPTEGAASPFLFVPQRSRYLAAAVVITTTALLLVTLGSAPWRAAPLLASGVGYFVIARVSVGKNSRICLVLAGCFALALAGKAALDVNNAIARRCALALRAQVCLSTRTGYDYAIQSRGFAPNSSLRADQVGSQSSNDMSPIVFPLGDRGEIVGVGGFRIIRGHRVTARFTGTARGGETVVLEISVGGSG